LAPPGGDQRLGPSLPFGIRQPVERGHDTTVEASDRRHARHPGRTVHPDGAASTLTLGAAPVLDRSDADLIAEDVEQRRPFVGYFDVGAVDSQPDQWISAAAAQRLS
jgi:hypothetical protein